MTDYQQAVEQAERAVAAASAREAEAREAYADAYAVFAPVDRAYREASNEARRLRSDLRTLQTGGKLAWQTVAAVLRKAGLATDYPREVACSQAYGNSGTAEVNVVRGGAEMCERAVAALKEAGYQVTVSDRRSYRLVVTRGRAMAEAIWRAAQ